MSEPSPEHIEAVALWLATMVGPTRGDRYARWLLTDPPEDVLDAMQDALVRTGRLIEGHRYVHAPTDDWLRNRAAELDPEEGDHE